VPTLALLGGRTPGISMIRNAIHADVKTTLRNGTVRTLAIDRGRATQRTDTSLTVTRADGQAVTFTIDARTRASYGWRGQRSIRRLRQNAAVTVVSEAGRALQVNASARAFSFR
jgi:hypothetical protein